MLKEYHRFDLHSHDLVRVKTVKNRLLLRYVIIQYLSLKNGAQKQY